MPQNVGNDDSWNDNGDDFRDDDHITAEPLRPRRERDDLDRPRSDRDVGLHRSAPHSGIGVAAFVIALLSGALSFGSIAIAVGHGVKNGPLPKNDPKALFVGLGILGGGALALVGSACGIAGLFASHRRIVFAVLGTILNLLIVFGICGVVGFGLAMGAR
jgi:hypothetical protein